MTHQQCGRKNSRTVLAKEFKMRDYLIAPTALTLYKMLAPFV